MKAPAEAKGRRLLRIAVLVALAGIAPLAAAQNPRVEFNTSAGRFVVELYPDKAPKTVANFLRYVHEGFYDGTLFHRVIDGFMIQGGGFDLGMRQKPTHAPIPNEAANALAGGLHNDFGTIAMARTSDPNSATSQFFINVKNNEFLDYRDPSPQGSGYAVFGRVISGMDTVLTISKTPTTTRGPFRDVPQQPVVIESARVQAPQ